MCQPTVGADFALDPIAITAGDVAPETFDCAHCGRTTPTDDESADAGHCQECHDSHRIECVSCDEFGYDGDHFQPDDAGDTYCNPCYDTIYTTCDRCDDETPRDSTTRTADGSDVCESCRRNHYSRCVGCDEYHDDEDIRRDRHGNAHCESCWDDRDSDNILSHADDTASEMGPLGDPGPKGEFYGVELEVECVDSDDDDDDDDDYKAGVSLDRLGRDFAIAKHDGSLNRGFELVTRPASVAEHRRHWTHFLARRPSGLKSWNTSTCGMHVHVSRSAFSPLGLGKLLVFINENENASFISSLAGRGPGQWCERMAKSLTDGRKRDCHRYQAVNTGNRETIEFRVFKGTLDPNGFMKNLEFVEACVAFVREAGCRELTIPHFVRFVGRTPKLYPALSAWLRDKGHITKPRPRPVAHTA